MIRECQFTSGLWTKFPVTFLLACLYPQVGDNLLPPGQWLTVIQVHSFLTTQPSSIPLSGESPVHIPWAKPTNNYNSSVWASEVWNDSDLATGQDQSCAQITSYPTCAKCVMAKGSAFSEACPFYMHFWLCLSLSLTGQWLTWLCYRLGSPVH